MAWPVSVAVQSEADHTGYGTQGALLAKGIAELGVEVLRGEHKTRDVPRAPVCVWNTVPWHGRWAWANQFKVAYTMWEATRLPELFRSYLANYDLVVVPNDHNRELLGQYHPNVQKVPLGYDPSVWSCARREVGREFRILVPCTGARKGTDLALSAFEQAFPDWEQMNPTPKLVVKVSQRWDVDRPYVEPIRERALPLDELVGLYRSCHAMLMPSRGEGWGFHPMQAVASGMPCVLSDVPGHKEYDYLPGFLVAYTKVGGRGVFHAGDGGEWWTPDENHVAWHLRNVYERYAFWQEEAREGARRMALRFHYSAMCNRLLDLLPAGDRRLGAREDFTEALFPVEVNRHLRKGDCSVGGTEYVLEPGRTYMVPAEVRRVLLRAGVALPHDDDAFLARNLAND